MAGRIFCLLSLSLNFYAAITTANMYCVHILYTIHKGKNIVSHVTWHNVANEVNHTFNQQLQIKYTNIW